MDRGWVTLPEPHAHTVAHVVGRLVSDALPRFGYDRPTQPKAMAALRRHRPDCTEDIFLVNQRIVELLQALTRIRHPEASIRAGWERSKLRHVGHCRK